MGMWCWGGHEQGTSGCVPTQLDANSSLYSDSVRGVFVCFVFIMPGVSNLWLGQESMSHFCKFFLFLFLFSEGRQCLLTCNDDSLMLQSKSTKMLEGALSWVVECPALRGWGEGSLPMIPLPCSLASKAGGLFPSPPLIHPSSLHSRALPIPSPFLSYYTSNVSFLIVFLLSSAL